MMTEPGLKVDDKATPTRRERVASDLAFLRSTVISTIIVLGILAVMVVTIRDLTRAPLVLEEIGVPEALQKEGYTGLVMSNMLWDQIEEIRNMTGTGDKTVRIQTASTQLDVVEPGSGLSLKRVTQILRSVFNFPQTRIAGEFVCPERACTPEQLMLTLRIFSGDGTRVIRSGPLGTQAMQVYMSNTALRLMEAEIDPLVAAWYHYYAETEDWEAQTIQLATRVMLERGPKTEEAITLLGYMALYNGDLTAAEDQSKEAEREGDETLASRGLLKRVAEVFAGSSHADVVRADTLTLRAVTLEALQRDDEAKQLYAQAVDLAPQVAQIRLEYAAILARLRETDRALVQFRQAAMLDPLDPYILIAWGDALEANGNFEEAARKREIATALSPNDLWVALATKTMTLDEALSDAKSWASDVPQDRDAWALWSDLLWRTSQESQADLCARGTGPVAEFVALATAIAPDAQLNEAVLLANEICSYVP